MLEFEQAHQWLEEAAKQEMREAQKELGIMYLKGVGVAQDLSTGLNWLEKAARQGKLDVEDQYFLGLACLSYPQATEEEKAKGFNWLEKAAMQGHLDAQLELGSLYIPKDNSRAPKDLTKALFWYQQAAEQGSSEGKSMAEELRKKYKL